MKKVVVGLSIAMLAVVGAYAGTFDIPFFNDGGTADSVGGFPSTGNATFITVRNGDLANPLVITVRYFDNDGTERTPANNTATIPAGAAVSWRPVATDPAEGVGNNVPNKDGGFITGTATIEFAGNAASGRVAVFNGNVQASYGFNTLLRQP
jgi:hypothetical protein